MNPRLLWITDPWDTLDHSKDTTLRLIEAAFSLGVECHWCDVKSIRWSGDSVKLDSFHVRSVAQGRGPDAFALGKSVCSKPSDFTRIIYRTDPPVDLAYLHPLQILELGVALSPGSTQETEIVNSPIALFMANEKLEAAFLGDLMPRTLVSSQWERLEEFGQTEQRTVLKPLYEAQSKGVELLDWTTSAGIAKAREILTPATESFQRPVLLQQYLAGISEGEKRLWFLNGRLLATARKKPKSGEFRVNMDDGGTLARVDLTPAEETSAKRIGERLRIRKIRMAAVDLIENRVTDFNLTSPGLLTGIEALLGQNLARQVIESLIRPWE